jgi:pro-kumamolisin-like protein/centrosomal CEP192-like protein
MRAMALVVKSSASSLARQFHKVLLLSALVATVSLSSWAQIARVAQIVRPIDETKLVRLAGNTHPAARPPFDLGLVDPAMPMERMLLVLKRSPQQEAALDEFMAEQYNPKSPNFHHWLHAQEFGEKYGPADTDIVQVTGWLQKWGFRVDSVNKGRTIVEFSGTAAQVQQAFHTQIHRYQVKGFEHIANDRDPQIPQALAPVITGVASLHDFFPKPQFHMGRLVKKDRKTGKITPLDASASSRHGMAPQYTFTNEYGDTAEDVTPFDFATIYNELPLWKAGTDGSGVPLAISACSDIDLNDDANFRATFGLPAKAPVVTHNGTDPGLVSGCQEENTLDVEWSGATAPGATIDMVVSGSTATTFGGELSDAYIIDNEIAPIMSASYGECELDLGTAGNAAQNSIWQQGATEGISIFESAGDQGSTGCESQDVAPPNAATTGLQVNGSASSPYVTAVGGTDFAWQIYPAGTYWSATNNADGASALGYIPEIPWNSTCASLFLATYAFNEELTPEELCNDATGLDLPDLIVISAGSGGKSACTTPSGTTPATCAGGYPKPSWQTGTGVPADGKRDLPDVSLFASAGYPDGIDGSAYLFCLSSASPKGTCDYSDPDYIIYQEVGGTSVSSPAMAGIMALVLQTTGAAQGLANPVFYALAATETLSDCNWNAVGGNCIFYDTTFGTNEQVCKTGSTNCVTNTSGDEYGIVSGYSTTTGYDLATGLGSVNAANLVNAWASAIGKVTLNPTGLAFPSTAVGVTSAAQTITLKNAGTGTLQINELALSGTDYKSYALSATTCPFAPTTLAAGSSCTISITFTPATTGTLTAQLNIYDNAIGTPQTAALTGTGATSGAPVVSLTPKTLTFASTKVGSTSAAKVVTLKNTGKSTLDINGGGITISGTDPSSFLVKTTTCGATLAAAASCTISVEFKPAASGTLIAALQVSDNAAGSPQSVSLSGTGAATAPVVSLTPKSLTFTSTKVGFTSAAKVVTLKNTGTATLNIKSAGITIVGTDKSSFTKTTTCGATVAVGASCTISVKFKPAATGALTATLDVADNAAGSPQSVSLAGTGK